MKKHPNVVFILTDQMRAQATGYEGDPNVRTPNLDNLAETSVVFSHAISNCPICTPYRGCLLTGQYPLTHGLFMNDVSLDPDALTLGKIFRNAGYATAYIGKWHVDGHGRSAYIPKERRQGFDYWKALECTHDYFSSYYYEGDNPEKKMWEGYDAYAQTEDAIRYIENQSGDDPFLLFLSFGTPHNPYETAPQDLLDQYSKQTIQLRPNVPQELVSLAQKELQGYYAHITAIDDCVGKIREHLVSQGLDKDTLFVFTSDHGDSMQSHCTKEFPGINKQRPYEESIRVPFLLHFPDLHERQVQTIETPLATPDILPTLLGLCGIPTPEYNAPATPIEGLDFSGIITGTQQDKTVVDREGVLIANYSPFSDWKPERGGRPYRGIRTQQFTYGRGLEGPWLLFDNHQDPYQLHNCVDDPKYHSIQQQLEKALQKLLDEQQDAFLPPEELRKKWGYTIDKNGSVPYLK